MNYIDQVMETYVRANNGLETIKRVSRGTLPGSEEDERAQMDITIIEFTMNKIADSFCACTSIISLLNEMDASFDVIDGKIFITDSGISA